MPEEITTAQAKKIRAEVAAKTRARNRSKARKVAAAGAKSQLEGFSNFIRMQGVIGLAIGLVLGVQVKAVVDQIVASFINPVLGLVLPGAGSLSEKTFTLSVGAKQAVFAYGAFISVMISFLTVAWLVYLGVKLLKLDKLDKKK